MTRQTVLRDAIDGHFTNDELKGLCFVLGIDYDHLEGGNKPARITSLILYCEHRGRADDLVAAVVAARPPLRDVLRPDVTPAGRSVAKEAADLSALLARPPGLNQAQARQLRDDLNGLVSAAAAGRAPDPQAVARVAGLIAAAGFSAADRRRAERLWRAVGGPPAANREQP